jgi:multiple sugar transport system substrate-binding protein
MSKIRREKMKKIVLIFIVISVMMALPFVGIVEAQKKFEGVTLDIPTMAGWRCAEPIWKREALLTEKTGIALNVHGFPHVELMSKTLSEFMASTGAFDTATAGAINQTLFESFVIPLNEYIERDFGSVEKFKELFYPWAIDYNTYDGEVKFIPYHLNAEYCVYRKDLFEDPAEKEAFKAQYGYELKPPETAEQLIDVAKFFTRPEEDLWGFVIMGKGPPGGWAIITSLYGAGFQTVDLETNEAPFKSGEARQKAIEVVSLWDDLIREHKVTPPGTAGIAHRDAYEMFIGGHAAMSFGWWGDFWDRLITPEIISDIGESGSFIFPTLDPKNGLPISTWGVGISQDSDNPEAAWEFIKFMISREIQLAMSAESGQGSPVKEFNEEAISEGWVAPALMNEAARGSMPIRSPRGFDVLDIYWTYSSSLFSGEKTPEEFIDLVIEKTEEVMK